jgi:hypothetical protein
MPRTGLPPKLVEAREIRSFTQQQVAAPPSCRGEPSRATVTRPKSAGRAESFLAILLAAFSMSPA